MPVLTAADVMEAGGNPDAARIYGDLAAAWPGFNTHYQRLMLIVRGLFNVADLSTNNGLLFGGSCVFCGGHVEVADEMACYSLWRAGLDAGVFPGGQRISSHQSTHTQYEIALPPGWGTLLFGVRNGGTWFQNEAYPITTTWQDYFGHFGTTIQYGATKVASALTGGYVQVRNIGAKGTSPLDDAHPVQIPNTWWVNNGDALIGHLGW